MEGHNEHILYSVTYDIIVQFIVKPSLNKNVIMIILIIIIIIIIIIITCIIIDQNSCKL